MEYNMELLKSEEKERHGGPFDRGSADSWYRRSPDPHYWTHGSYHGERIGHNRMSEQEISDYYEGYEDNEKSGGHKEY
jgi:hypothetical protein